MLRLCVTTAVSYINKKGGIKAPECNRVAKVIWEWCITQNLNISASHIPGKNNTEADLQSRKHSSDSTEWMLHPELFQKITNKFGTPDIENK